MVTATPEAPVLNERAYRDELWSRLGYVPTPEQRVIHDSSARQKLVTGGEGSGKSHQTAMIIVEAVPLFPDGLIWIIANEYDDCREEFKYTVDWLRDLDYLNTDPSYPGEGQCRLVANNGCVVVTKSAKDPIKIGRESPDLIAFVEAARASYESYLRVRGRIARSRGKLHLSGTLEGSLGWYPELAVLWSGPNADDAESFSLPTWTNSYKYPGGRQDPEILKLQETQPHDYFLERYGGVICRPSGLVIKEFSNKIHLRRCEYNPEVPVEIAIDPGFAGAYVVHAIQKYAEHSEVIAEKYLTGYVTEEIITMCRQDWPWYNKIQRGAIDIAAKQHQGMPAPIEIWREKGGIALDCTKVQEESGIEVLRTFLKVNPVSGKPKIYYDLSCQGVIAEMGGGKSPVHGGGAWLRDDNTGKPINKNDHACKTDIYWLVNRFGYVQREGRQVVKVQRFY